MDDKTALGNERKLSSSHDDFQQQQSNVIYDAQEEPKGSLVQRFFRKTWQQLLEPGSALQIVIAAAVAIGIGLAVSSTVDDIPRPASVILAIPGQLWLRALKAVVLPLIAVAMIIAAQQLKEMAKTGAKLARYTILWYVFSTLLAIAVSIIMTSQVWSPLMTVASRESLDLSEEDAAAYEDRSSTEIEDIVQQIFYSFIPANVVDAMATDSLLAVLVSSVTVGYLIDPTSPLLKAVKEIERIIMIIIIFLIKLAPIGVFFLILPNMFKLDIRDVGQNLGILIGGSITSMLIHLLVVLPIVFFAITRRNPYTYWIQCSKAWITAWGSASSAATLPLTIQCAKDRGNPDVVVDFAVPLGCLINMDGTAIYFPVVVVFLAQTQGISLSAGDYIIVLLLSTLSAIATTPIPSSSLVLTVVIASSVNVPLSGMYAVVVAIDWFIDRFRTVTNVSGDLYAAGMLTKLTGITESPSLPSYSEEAPRQSAQVERV